MSKRFRLVPSFGRDTIRRFTSNISELKQLAARDFEDLLQVSQYSNLIPPLFPYHFQCSIPVFDGLLPEPHNTAILELLFVCAHWHALAKLRMHTDYTLALLDKETEELGARLRAFSDKTCTFFDTKELRRETAARYRRNAKKAHSPKQRTSRRPRNPASTDNDAPRKKRYHLRTIKHHALGDYVKHIRMFGTSDSFSTEPVSHHRFTFTGCMY